MSVDELGARPNRVAATTAWVVAGFGAMFLAFGAGGRPAASGQLFQLTTRLARFTRLSI